MDRCNAGQIDAYLADALRSYDLGAFEAHLATCEACQAVLETATAGAASAVRGGTKMEPVSERVERRVQKLTSHRPSRRLAGPILAMAAIAGVLMFRPGATPDIRATLVSGTAFADRRLSSGEFSLPATLMITGAGEIAYGKVLVRTQGVARFRLSHDRGTLSVVPLMGRIEVASGELGLAALRSGRWTAPVEGRCLAAVSPSGEIRLTSLSGQTVVSEGRTGRTIPKGYSTRLAVWALEPAADDPFALASLGAELPSFLGQLAASMKVALRKPSLAENLSADELAALGRAQASESLSDIVEAAKHLAVDEKAESAALMTGWALRLSSSLAGVSVEDRRILAVGLARDYGDLDLASQCADIPELAGWKRFIDAWKNLPEFPSMPQRVAAFKAAKAIVPKNVSERLAIAEGYGWIGRARAGEKSDVRWETGLLAASKLGAEVAGDVAASPAQRAMGFHAASESLHYVPGRKIEALDELLKAIALWRRPHWLVHYAARAVEDKKYDRNLCASMAIEGLGGDPSFDSFDRAMIMLHDLCKAPEDMSVAEGFTVWVADAFPSVPIAQDHCGSGLKGWYHSRDAERILRRYKGLIAGGVPKFGGH